jgi:hypothetical protein
VKRLVAAAELLLILPAVLFIAALFVRNLQPAQSEPAHTAAQIVQWYSAWPLVGLWVLLIALPAAVLVTGARTLLRDWTDDAVLREAAWRTIATIRGHLATVVVAATTVVAGVILAIVALHVLTD